MLFYLITWLDMLLQRILASFGFVAVSFDLVNLGLARRYVIAGGGSAGLLLAVQLSTDPRVTVTVLEAGGSGYGNASIYDPRQRMSIMGTEFDWKFQSIPQSQLNNTIIPVQRGKVLGGSSAMNALIMHRSGKYEYDLWESLGNRGWNWNSFFKSWKDLETFHPPAANSSSVITYRKDHHGFTGPISTTLQTNVSSLFTDFVIPTMHSLGHAIADVDGEGGNATGAGFRPLAILPLNFTRSFSGSAYFHVEGRPNLRVLTHAQATRITWKSRGKGLAVATGFEYVDLDTGLTHSVNGTDIIVSGGAISTPPLLEYSGIGDPAPLQKYGIQPVVNLSAVGTDLQDHPAGGVTFTWNRTVTHGDDVNNYIDCEPAQAFLSSQEYETGLKMLSKKPPGVSQRHFDVVKKMYINREPMFEYHWTGPFNYTVTFLLHPLSHGSVHINSSDPLAPPTIDPQILAADFDTWLFSKGIKYLARNITNTPPFNQVVGSIDIPDSVVTDNDWLAAARAGVRSGQHFTGGCAMLPRKDGGVVDTNLLVYGTKNVRVVDVSVVPFQTGGHTMNAAYGIAQRAYEILIGK
ncbi:alcohol oxidase [Ceratobasidium sp. AG-I]|nr:alcohol oxidase [Ceratobasidium sp. AG-I]